MSAATTVRALIDARAIQYPNKPFLLAAPDEGDDGRAGGAPADTAMTFAALRERCQTLEARFRLAGLRPGDVVTVFMGNGVQTATLLLGAMYSGLIAHPLNLLCQPSQLRYIVEHSDTRMIFFCGETSDAITAVCAELRAQGMTREIALVHTAPDAVDLPALPTLEVARSAVPETTRVGTGDDESAMWRDAAAPTDVALLMYTSGTTGAPKGVLLSHHNLVANARNISAEHRLGPDDRVLASLPLYHINGLVVTILAPLYHAGSAVLTPRFSARTFWREAARLGCTWINVVPTIVAYLLNGDEPRGLDLSALKFCRSASAALPADHHRAFEARFGIGIIETMGMTETAAPIFSNPYEPARRRIGSVGLPSGAEAKVIDREGRECAANEPGEIVLRGEQVTRGYYKRPEETAKAFTADGWLRTGDLGYRDADGYFYINGRSKELIIKGGENIAPREIDEALLRHPGVLDAAAVGVPDSAYGQEIVAFVVLREADGANAPDADQLRAHCLGELGRYKTPKEFRFVSELPRGPSGKVQRLKLLAPAPD
ncbi:long-chain acyl-CoA synthetase [Trinickia symbiotica]|uniref:Long-chain fatty acid--CoA ligase n=1 Tax=Trinickia symbiotica TaxID=863227 RepID=A0A2N7X9V4_9BURK|nr:AMP-binding protein [Trinickia symbiotica]PMS38387.1 long-chain fatty acid--CoA ligase [Trinickia symbiotica]PPK42012.1 long-chain acyl-CoA synthetase [Trinickia symbiotica]